MHIFGHWIFPIEFDHTEWFGFIYRITELSTGREYLGKKQFGKLQRKVIKGRKNRKHIHSESNWKEYTGSSIHLNEQIELNTKDNYKFEIVSLHKSKGSLHYAEVKIQIEEDVLRAYLPDGVTRKYYNKIINSVKYIPPDTHPDELAINNALKEIK